jgi:hypothetical protein
MASIEGTGVHLQFSTNIKGREESMLPARSVEKILMAVRAAIERLQRRRGSGVAREAG